MTHEDLPDHDRYDTANDWQPKPTPAKYKKLLADYKKAHPEEFCFDSIFETRPANDCTRTPAAKKQQHDLFGPLWRTGELAVLVGESGVGKSILAVQIAESIARGRPVRTGGFSSPPARGGVALASSDEVVGGDRIPASGNYQFSTLNSKLAPAQPVLYLDLQHSDAQFAERYRCPSPVAGKLPVRYRFSSKLSRTSYGDLRIPEAFRGDVARYYRHSLNRMLTSSEAKVLIVDNLTLLDPRSSGAAAAIRTMQMLKRLTLKYGFSILVLAQSKQKIRIQRSAAGDSYSSLFTIHSSLTGIADSVFAIGRSTYAPDFRYIKQLKSTSSAITHDAANVLVYQLGRMQNAWSTENRQHKTENPQLVPASGNFPLSTFNFPLDSAAPFLGFKYLGLSAESSLIRDYEREYREALAREQSRLHGSPPARGGVDTLRGRGGGRRRSSREIRVDGIIDGSYQRYLRGE